MINKIIRRNKSNIYGELTIVLRSSKSFQEEQKFIYNEWVRSASFCSCLLWILEPSRTLQLPSTLTRQGPFTSPASSLRKSQSLPGLPELLKGSLGVVNDQASRVTDSAADPAPELFYRYYNCHWRGKARLFEDQAAAMISAAPPWAILNLGPAQTQEMALREGDSHYCSEESMSLWASK